VSPLNQTAQDLSAGAGALSQIASIFANISYWIAIGIGFLTGLGLTQTQAYVVVGIVFLIAFLSVLKFLGLVTKILIVLLILWVFASIVGLL
jgi:hypothetical protein